MIGFSIPVRIYDEDGAIRHETLLLSLDNDAIEADGEPALDVRLAGDDSVIGNASVTDVYDAVDRIESQFRNWKREGQS